MSHSDENFCALESRTSLAFLEDSKRVQQFNSSSILPLRLSRLHQKVHHTHIGLLIANLSLFQDLMTTPSTMTNTSIWRSAGRRVIRSLVKTSNIKISNVDKVYQHVKYCHTTLVQEEDESIFCSGATPPPPYTLAINV